MFLLAVMRLFKVVASAFITKKEKYLHARPFTNAFCFTSMFGSCYEIGSRYDVTRLKYVCFNVRPNLLLHLGYEIRLCNVIIRWAVCQSIGSVVNSSELLFLYYL